MWKSPRVIISSFKRICQYYTHHSLFYVFCFAFHLPSNSQVMNPKLTWLFIKILNPINSICTILKTGRSAVVMRMLCSQYVCEYARMNKDFDLCFHSSSVSSRIMCMEISKPSMRWGDSDICLIFTHWLINRCRLYYSLQRGLKLVSFRQGVGWIIFYGVFLYGADAYLSWNEIVFVYGILKIILCILYQITWKYFLISTTFNIFWK